MRPAAPTATEHGEQGRSDAAEPLLTDAREAFERLGQRPWLERLDAARPATVRA